MANSPQAKKRIRQSAKNRLVNSSHKSRARTSVKKIISHLKANDSEAAKKAFSEAVPILDGMVNRGLYSSNKTARLKKRLNLKIKLLN